MTIIFALTRPAAGVPDAFVPDILAPDAWLQWAAFRLLCLWTRSDPESVARMLGADGFDAGFGLGGGS